MSKKVMGQDGKMYKVSKPFYKKVWFWVLIVLLFFGIGGALSGGENKDSATATSTSTNKETTTKEEKTYKIGDDVAVGKMEYKVNSVEVVKQVGPSVLPTNAKDTFLVVDLSVKNAGDKAVTIDSSFFKLKADGKTFEADSAASMSANQDENGNITNSFFMESLNPDMQQTGKIVFDIPEAQANAQNNVLQAQTGYFGTETVSIALHN
ncbi:TPA: DUF4352 domain-containing protein [Enterococcus faecium]|uniref:DUF4352 domain-containing protein n=1 Tax=Enterococcus lactis TaxID=357441 RepID=UPI0019DA4BFF|nr:DUF4352 domain-containing protein [Enterococcus faecium]EGP4997228.1 DUF4352 domain-containing protein [Enterococcus faecium]EGP5109041.1 DUF4352 domain-containing protein [Enterococcus faecium]EGP5362103.1 DUF4352 domain-containing protein [Enterococcus faecium]EGP5526459.1 DUF4352 domain-containing protein [Enterococcus faecium]